MADLERFRWAVEQLRDVPAGTPLSGDNATAAAVLNGSSRVLGLVIVELLNRLEVLEGTPTVTTGRVAG